MNELKKAFDNHDLKVALDEFNKTGELPTWRKIGEKLGIHHQTAQRKYQGKIKFSAR